MAKLNVALVTPERQVARVEVDMVTAPSVMGEVGILPDHQPLLANLQPGVVLLQAGNKTERYAVSGGVLEVDRNTVTILAETAEHASEIDEGRANDALKDASGQLEKLDSQDPKFEEQVARIHRAQIRLAVLGKSKN
ncbi:MAG: ATP synthase F1 subunit epsilon [Deltaproteobacteria bacterium RIFOXYA12_FULL_58_15]|nr:MAG: ATP synthase F1 subunit epsilon [Deltaproteobacteria bacterium RIFOXYA12_FULL_58_15]